MLAAPLSLPETDDNENDPKTNQDDPRNEKRPSARQENGEQSRADERNDPFQHEGVHQRQVARRAMSRMHQCQCA